MVHKKRPKAICEIISSVNARLKAERIKNEGDTLFRWALGYLMARGMYEGYNYFKSVFTPNGNVDTLAGSSTDFDFLQIY